MFVSIWGKVCFVDEDKANQGDLTEEKIKFSNSASQDSSLIQSHQKPKWIGYNYKVVYKVFCLTGGL